MEQTNWDCVLRRKAVAAAADGATLPAHKELNTRRNERHADAISAA